MYFLVNASSPKPLDEATSNFVDEYHIMYWVMLCVTLTPQGQIMDFLINASSPKRFDLASKNFIK